MIKRGTYKYIPKELLNELEEIKLNFNIDKDSNAFRKMTEFSNMGRELTINLNFDIKRRRR